jgi:hypothetical protein
MPKQIFQRAPQPKRMKMGAKNTIPGQNQIPVRNAPTKTPRPGIKPAGTTDNGKKS